MSAKTGSTRSKYRDSGRMIDAPEKTCQGCGKTFGPHQGEWASEYRRRRNCSRACGTRREGSSSTPPLEPVHFTEADIEWRRQGACAASNTDLFYPNTRHAAGLLQEATAKAMCESCPVPVQCLDWALRYGEQGIWGGTNDNDRKAMKKEAAA